MQFNSYSASLNTKVLKNNCFCFRYIMKEANILIIGAGVAGLSAAYNLIEHKINNITIFEAKNKIVYFKSDNSLVDLEKHHINAEDNSLHLLKSLCLSYDQNKVCVFCNLSGKFISLEFTKKCEDIFWEVLELCETQKYNTSFDNCFQEV